MRSRWLAVWNVHAAKTSPLLLALGRADRRCATHKLDLIAQDTDGRIAEGGDIRL